MGGVSGRACSLCPLRTLFSPHVRVFNNRAHHTSESQRGHKEEEETVWEETKWRLKLPGWGGTHHLSLCPWA